MLGDETRPASQTTPEALELQAMLARDARRAASAGVAMEVSSHALALARADGLAFDVAVFTNLTQDHLDFHGTLERTAGPSGSCSSCSPHSPKPARTAVVNADDPAGAEMVARSRPAGADASVSAPARTCERRAHSALDGIRMTVADAARPLLAAPRR